MSSDELIFITGASGFLGAHIVEQLLNNGYRVRAAARGAKVGEMEKAYANFGDKFEAITIADIASGSFPAAFKGVDAVIHTAAPIPNKASAEEILKGAEEGTINIIRQAQEAGIKKFVITSSIATVAHPKSSFTDKDWNPVTKEDALKGDDLNTYRAAKTFAELALWEFAEQHKDIDITTLNPPFLYGPLASGFTMPEPNYAALSTDLYIYRLLTPTGSYPSSPVYIDVRDAARAHINALTSPPEAAVGRKRIVMASPFENRFEKIVELIAQKRPELKSRLTTKVAPSYPVYKAPIDLQRVQDVVGVKIDSYKSWEETFLDTIDSLLELEKRWEAAGHVIDIPKA